MPTFEECRAHAKNPGEDGYEATDPACVECKRLWPEYAGECEKLTLERLNPKEVTKVEAAKEVKPKRTPKVGHTFRTGTARGTAYELLQEGKSDSDIIQILSEKFKLSSKRAKAKLGAVKKLS